MLQERSKLYKKLRKYDSDLFKKIHSLYKFIIQHSYLTGIIKVQVSKATKSLILAYEFENH